MMNPDVQIDFRHPGEGRDPVCRVRGTDGSCSAPMALYGIPAFAGMTKRGGCGI
jgi:hypothetical protein